MGQALVGSGMPFRVVDTKGGLPLATGEWAGEEFGEWAVALEDVGGAVEAAAAVLGDMQGAPAVAAAALGDALALAVAALGDSLAAALGDALAVV